MSNTMPIEPLIAPRRPGERDRGSAPRTAPSRLRAVPTEQPSRRLSPLVGSMIAVGIILLILASQLGLSILVSQGAYEMRVLEVEDKELTRVERILTQSVERLSSPQNLAENAVKLEMVASQSPANLRLSDGAVLGNLDAKTSAAQDNLIANSSLENTPLVDADGLLVARNDAGAASNNSTRAPVRLEGKLPAPKTH